MTNSPDSGSSWCTSATRPAAELSTGITATSALPSVTLSSACSKLTQGSSLHSGYRACAAVAELDPGSP